jgi:hypothetical protein
MTRSKSYKSGISCLLHLYMHISIAWIYVRFEVLTVVTMKSTVFWVVPLCSLEKA